MQWKKYVIKVKFVSLQVQLSTKEVVKEPRPANSYAHFYCITPLKWHD